LHPDTEVDETDISPDFEEALRLTKEKILEEEKAASGLTPSEAANLFAGSRHSRPKSAPAARPGSLQAPKRASAEEADIDRYVQKQLFLRAKEKEDALAKKKYEVELRERK
jgi:hypothetical protein